jgi:hypothetical protein
MTDTDTISGTCTNGPLVLSREVFRALGSLEQVAALALEKVGKVQIVESSEVAGPVIA